MNLMCCQRVSGSTGQGNRTQKGYTGVKGRRRLRFQNERRVCIVLGLAEGAMDMQMWDGQVGLGRRRCPEAGIIGGLDCPESWTKLSKRVKDTRGIETGR